MVGLPKAGTRRLTVLPPRPLPRDPWAALLLLNVVGTTLTLLPCIPFYIAVLKLSVHQAMPLLGCLVVAVVFGFATDAWLVRRHSAPIAATLRGAAAGGPPDHEAWRRALVTALNYRISSMKRTYSWHVWVPTALFSVFATIANLTFDLRVPAWNLLIAVPVTFTVLPLVHAVLEYVGAPWVLGDVIEYAQTVLGRSPDPGPELRRVTLAQKLLVPFLVIGAAPLIVVAVAAGLKSADALLEAAGTVAASVGRGGDANAWVGRLKADGTLEGPAGGPEAEAVRAAAEGAEIRVDTDAHVVGIGPMDTDGGWPVVAVPRGPLVARAWTVVRWMLLVGLVGLLISILLWFVFMKEIRDNTGALLEALDRVSAGNLTQPPKVLAGDEFGDLAHRIGEAMEKLQERERLQDLFGRHTSPEVVKVLLEQEGALGGTRQEATILFSDIRSFTTMSEMMEPEAVVALLNRYFGVMVSALLAHHGRVDKFIGDGMLAVFGAPVADPDHAGNAVRSALAMREGLAKLNIELVAEGRAPIRFGVGIHSGPVLCGCIGSPDRMEFTVIGDTVNAASRIEGLSKKFETDIVVSGRVYAATQALFDYDRQAAEDLKGKTQRMDVFVLRGAKSPGGAAKE